MKVCIYGAGAIGGYLAAGLAQVDGVDLTVIARGRHLEAMRSNGLTLVRTDGTTNVRVRATDDPYKAGPQDCVILALKAHQAWQVAEQTTHLLGADTTVVTCQNGVPWWYFHKLAGRYEGNRLRSVDPFDRQWRLIGPERVIGCVVYPATEIAEPGIVRHVYGDKFAIGEPDGSLSDRARAIAAVLIQAGFKAPVLDDVRSEIWLKLWGNLCFNPISVLTRSMLDVVATDPATRPIAEAMMSEAEAIAGRLGATFRVSMSRRIEGAAKVGAHRTSMLQDFEAGRSMEIDALVTAVQELGRIVGVATPMIDTVLGLVTRLGRSCGLYESLVQEECCNPVRDAVAAA